MSNSKPKVFISSTIYDFRDLRSALKYWLETLGYEVYLSEYGDFPTDSGRSSYDCCFQVIDQCDYFILLIGSRVGGWYNESERISITQAEYRHAYQRMVDNDSIKIVSFVRKEIWDVREDRKALEKYLENNAIFESITEDQKKRIVSHPSKFVTNQFIKKAILDGIFLTYDNSSQTYVTTPLHQALMKLSTYIEQFVAQSKSKIEEVGKIAALSMQLDKQCQCQNFVSIDNRLLIYPFGSYLIQKNTVLILKAILQYLGGNENALELYEEQLISTFVFSSKEEIEKEELLKPTPSQIETWVQQK